MKSSPLALRKLLVVMAAGLAAVTTAGAQDAVVLKSGLTREGKITGVSAGSVRLQMGSGATGIPLADIREIRMDAPPEFDAAAAKLSAGDTAAATGVLEKITQTYAGLPAPWAERALALLGDAKLAAGDKEGAAAVYDKLTETYPQAKSLANLGRARLAVDGGKFSEAEPLLQPLLDASAKTALPAASDGPAFTQAHYLAGRIKEAAGELEAALVHYLKASALFPFDKASASSAQKRADALRAEHAGLIAP
jgi:tetratricopeptide (TPR) repeat protein